jgi:hypothetical protein
MAAIGTRAGSVALGNGDCDFQTLNVRMSEPHGEVTSFDVADGCSRNRGSGITTYNIQCAGFINANNVGSTSDEEGDAATFTIAAGRTITGDFISHDISYNGSAIGYSWPITFDLVNAGLVVDTV